MFCGVLPVREYAAFGFSIAPQVPAVSTTSVTKCGAPL